MIWILRKHPPHPYRNREHLEAFTILGTYNNRELPDELATLHNNNKQSTYYYTVKKLTVKEST